MVQTRKFSQFTGPSPIQNGDIVVGLRMVDGRKVNFQFSDVGTGGGAGGTQVVITQPGHGFIPGDWVRIGNDGLFHFADSTTDEKAEVEGTVKSLDPDDPLNVFTLQYIGFVEEGTFTGLVPGGVYFLSGTTPGQMTLTENLNNGEVSLPLFIAYTATTGFIRDFRGIINNGQAPVLSDAAGDNGEPVVELITQNGHGFSIGEALYVDNTNHYARAIADGSIPNGEKAIGFVAASPVPTLNTFYLQQSGFMAGFIAPTTPLTAATQYWLSTTTAGRLQDTAPTALGHYTKPMLVATNASAGWILPQRPLLISATTDNPVLQTITQAAHGFTYVGEVVKPQTGAPNVGKYEAANGSNLTGAFGVGMINSIIDINTFIVQEVGYLANLGVAPITVPGGIANPAFPLNNGVPYYLSATDAGQITTVAPISPFYSKPIFMADQTGAGWILPMKPTLGAGGGGAGGAIVQCLAFEDHTPHLVNYSSVAFAPIPYLSATITPTSATSKIRINFCFSVNQQYSSFYNIFRNGVRIPGPAGGMFYAGPTNGIPSGQADKTLNFMYIDSPATAAAVTYDLRILSSNAIGAVVATFNLSVVGIEMSSSWTVEEIAV